MKMRISILGMSMVLAVSAFAAEEPITDKDPLHNLNQHHFCFLKNFPIAKEAPLNFKPNPNYTPPPPNPGMVKIRPSNMADLSEIKLTSLSEKATKESPRVQCYIQSRGAGAPYSVPSIGTCPLKGHPKGPVSEVALKASMVTDAEMEESLKHRKEDSPPPASFLMASVNSLSFLKFEEVKVGKKKVQQLFIPISEDPLLSGIVCRSRVKKFDVRGMNMKDLLAATKGVIAFGVSEVDAPPAPLPVGGPRRAPPISDELSTKPVN